jgi:FkbM family methyltransferase
MEKQFKTHIFRGKEFKIIRGATHPDYSYATFDEEEKDFREQYWDIHSGDIVFDVGASYGSYTLTACAYGATVYAFEPEKTVFDDLVSKVGINGWQKQCFPMNIGLWDSKNCIDMKSYAPHWPAFAISTDYKMDTLDHIAQMLELTKLDWIKIDVEGAEERVISGGLATIEKFKPSLMVECHSFLDKDMCDKVKTLLSSVHNYSFNEVVRDPCVLMLVNP